MSDVKDLIARINAELSVYREKAAQFRSQQVEEHKGRQERLERLEAVFDQLRAAWRPRLETLAEKFKDSVQVTPIITPGRRQATFAFQSPLARISLRLAASTDTDVTKLVLSYDLDILPIYMQFEKHVEKEFPLDQVDAEAAAQWLDDRIVAFVKVYLSLYDNEYYSAITWSRTLWRTFDFPSLSRGRRRSAAEKPTTSSARRPATSSKAATAECFFRNRMHEEAHPFSDRPVKRFRRRKDSFATALGWALNRPRGSGGIVMAGRIDLGEYGITVSQVHRNLSPSVL